MDITQISTYLLITLSVLTFVCAWAVIPYRLNPYNTDWLPAGLRPNTEAVDSKYHFYYPADEARGMLAVALFAATLWTAIPAFILDAAPMVAGIPYLYALIPAAYLLHRYFCFHRLNRFTPEYVAVHSPWMMTYRLWLIVLIWLYTLVLPVAAVFDWLPKEQLNLLTLPPVVGMLLYVGVEFVNYYRENQEDSLLSRPSQWFTFTIPRSYYFAWAVVSVALTGAALWLSSLILLVVWVVLLLAFTVAEFYCRFCNDTDEVDSLESWGTDRTRLRLTLDEELWLIRRKEWKALRKKNHPCQLLIIRRKGGLLKYDIEITADLDNKLRELFLRKETLLYVRTFNTLHQARLYAARIESCKDRIEELIQQNNPQHNDLKGFNIRTLA